MSFKKSFEIFVIFKKISFSLVYGLYQKDRIIFDIDLRRGTFICDKVSHSFDASNNLVFLNEVVRHIFQRKIRINREQFLAAAARKAY